MSRVLQRTVVAAAILCVVQAIVPSGTLAETAACEDGVAENRHAGNDRSVTNWSAFGLKATINPLGATFVPCDGSGGPLSADGPEAWVGITSNPADVNSIVQIGIINCNAPLVGTCDGNSAHYFFADGGCNMNLPLAEDLGSASMAAHEYRIERSVLPGGQYRWQFYVDNVERKYLLETNASINCWITGDRDADWFGETWDGGDGFADASNKLNFTSAGYRSSGFQTTWTNPGWDAASHCMPGADNSNSLDYKCDVTGTDKFTLWSVRW